MSNGSFDSLTRYGPDRVSFSQSKCFDRLYLHYFWHNSLLVSKWEENYVKYHRVFFLQDRSNWEKMAVSLENTTQVALDCPVYGPYSDYYIQQVNFWVEGVIQTIVAIPGLIGKLHHYKIQLGSDCVRQCCMQKVRKLKLESWNINSIWDTASPKSWHRKLKWDGLPLKTAWRNMMSQVPKVNSPIWSDGLTQNPFPTDQMADLKRKSDHNKFAH